MPAAVAPDLEEIIDLCRQLQYENLSAKAAKLVSKIAQIADAAAADIATELAERGVAA